MLVYSLNPTLDLLCQLLVFVIFLYNYIKTFNYSIPHKGTSYFTMGVIMVIVSLFYKPEHGDFWGYLKLYETQDSGYVQHMEDFYVWLIKLIPNNYLLWRFVIWSAATIVTILTFKIFKIPSNLATVVFFTFALFGAFYYTRNCLGLSVLYFSIAFFSTIKTKHKNKTRYVNIAIIVLLLSLSWFLHKSMPIYIAIVLLSFFLKVNKKLIIVSLIAFPFLYLLTYNIANEILMMNIWISGESDSGMSYLEIENTYSINWKGFVQEIFHYVPFVYFYYCGVRYIEQRKSMKVANDWQFVSFKVFYFTSYLILYLSFLLLGYGSILVSKRIFTSAMTPFSFCLCLYFMQNWDRKEIKKFSLLTFAYFAYIYTVGFLKSV